MDELIQQFNLLIAEYMAPWLKGSGSVPVRLKTYELLAFASEFFNTSRMIKVGEEDKVITLGVDEVNASMKATGFFRDVAHSEFDGLQVSWLVSLKKHSPLFE